MIHSGAQGKHNLDDDDDDGVGMDENKGGQRYADGRSPRLEAWLCIQITMTFMIKHIDND